MLQFTISGDHAWVHIEQWVRRKLCVRQQCMH